MSVEQRILYRIPEACERLSVSRSRMFELMKRGEIESVLVGGSRLVVGESMQRFVDRLRSSVVS